MDTRTDLSQLSDAELARMEKEIARKYIGGVPWGMVVWAFANVATWFALWPLVLFGVIPLWAGFLIATLNMCLAYLPSHEAQHSNIAKEGHPLRWLNELVGHISTLPMLYPYRVLRVTHMAHHAYTNDPEKDPDYFSNAPNWYMNAWNTIQSYQPGYDDSYGKMLGELAENGHAEAKRAITEAILYRLISAALLFALAWGGFALEAFFLWWLPMKIGPIYLRLFLSWAPHFPFEEKGRYRDTRAWRCGPVRWFGLILSSGMEYHVVHHLHPAIPLFRNGPAYDEMRDIIIARGIRNDGM